MRNKCRLFGFILLVVLSVSCFSTNGAAAGAIAVGTTIPEFKLTAPTAEAEQEYLGLQGSEPFTLAQVPGKLFILDFFNSMCGECQKAAPTLNRLFSAIKEDPALNKDIKMFGVAVGDEWKQIAAFKKQFRLFFPVVPDTDGDVYSELGIPGVPYTVVVNREGKVLMTHAGAIPDLDKKLKDIRELHKQQ